MRGLAETSQCNHHPIRNEEAGLCPGQEAGPQGQVKVQPVWRGTVGGGSGWARWTGVEGTPKPDPLLPATALRTAWGFSGCPRMPYKLGQPESGVPRRGVPSDSNLALVIRGLPGPTWALESPKDLASHLSWEARRIVGTIQYHYFTLRQGPMQPRMASNS